MTKAPEKLQEGATTKVPAAKNTSWLPSLFQSGRKSLSDRQKKLDEDEKKAAGYAKGGLVKRADPSIGVRRGYGKARGA